MKRIFIIAGLAISTVTFSQVKTNYKVNEASINDQTPFFDASSSSNWNATTNIGKGLVFPQVDLAKLKKIEGPKRLGSTNAPTGYDGMVVYNTNEGGTPAIGDKSKTLKRGFYYYKNDSKTDLQAGNWVRIGGGEAEVATGIDNGNFWTLEGNSGTKGTNFLGTTDKANVVMKVNTSKAGIPSSDQGTYNPTKLILGNAEDKPAFTKVVIGGTEQEQQKALASMSRNVPESSTTSFNFVLEVFGKARFSDGIVTKASTYPDYVFDNYFTGKSDVNPNYEFKKLNEVEAFIKENNHLPGVTKIDDLAKTESGYEIDNTQLSIQTLEKVEELYLHVIEQQKEIQALKAEIAELKK